MFKSHTILTPKEVNQHSSSASPGLNFCCHKKIPLNTTNLQEERGKKKKKNHFQKAAEVGSGTQHPWALWPQARSSLSQGTVPPRGTEVPERTQHVKSTGENWERFFSQETHFHCIRPKNQHTSNALQSLETGICRHYTQGTENHRPPEHCMNILSNFKWSCSWVFFSSFPALQGELQNWQSPPLPPFLPL